jgi:hypothetical protein
MDFSHCPEVKHSGKEGTIYRLFEKELHNCISNG